MPLRRILTALVAFWLVTLSGPISAQEEAAPADEILLKNGSRILGTITGTRDGVVTVETGFAGTLRVTQAEIVEMRSRSPVTMKLSSGEFVTQQPITVSGEQLQVTTAEGQLRNYPLEELLVVNPEPWELGQGYKWSGLGSVAAEMKKGNSETEELDYRIETYWRSLRDRYTLIFTGEQDEANDQKSADNWMAVGKYDRFLEGPWYWGLNVAAESDKFKDLDLRYYAGPYVGRQFYEEPILTLAVETGITYVNEDYFVADDQEYPGLNWSVRMSSNYLGGESRLYLDHAGLWNLDETSDLVLNTTFGLAFPLLFNFEAAAEILLEYDTGAQEGVEELDETYSFRIGYTW